MIFAVSFSAIGQCSDHAESELDDAHAITTQNWERQPKDYRQQGITLALHRINKHVQHFWANNALN